MKFPYFIYDYIANDDWCHLENILGYSNPKDYLGFDLPFNFKELYNGKSSRWNELEDICTDYVKKHKVEIVKKEETYHDLEKGYDEYEVTFSFDDKYYQTEYYSSPWESPYEHGYPDEAKEVFPRTKTITITEYY